MKKIGIITFHNAINYGAVLQCYATQRYLEANGHDVEIVDYRNKQISDAYEQCKFSLSRMVRRKPWHIFRYIASCIFFHKKNKGFSDFVNRKLRLSTKVFLSDNPSCLDYDIFLIGSDQVWNTNFTGGFDPYYWGEFKSKQGSQLIAWSASSKEGVLRNDMQPLISKYLSNFSAISVREQFLSDFLSPLGSQPIYLTLDPTFLLSKSEWETLCPQLHDKKYVLVYAMQDESDVITLAEKLGKTINKKVVVINPYSNGIIREGYKQTLSPFEFLAYIKNADYVLTSSFHGTAFSIIFEKQFYCYIKKGSTNVRIESILSQVCLLNRMVNADSEFDLQDNIDYSEVTMLKDKLVIETCAFLANSIG